MIWHKIPVDIVLYGENVIKQYRPYRSIVILLFVGFNNFHEFWDFP